MKKIAKVIIAFAAVGLLASATPASAQMFWIGFNLGGNVNRFRTPQLDNIFVGNGFGWNAGFFLRYGKKPYYEVGFNWIRSNVTVGILDSFDNSGNAVYDEEVYPMHSFDMTVKVGYPIIYTPVFKWRINAGPMLATPFIFSPDSRDQDRDAFRRPQFGFQVGTGFDLWNFEINLDYNHHVTQLFDPIDLGGGDEFEIVSRLQVLMLKFGFHF